MPTNEEIQQTFQKIVLAFDSAFDMVANKKVIDPLVEQIRQQALERVRLNAPVDTGGFRNSLFVETTVNQHEIIFDFGSTMPDRVYRLHEEEYHLGAVSEEQPTTVEGGVGNKFFTRVIDYWEDIWAQQIEDAIIDIITQELTS